MNATRPVDLARLSTWIREQVAAGLTDAEIIAEIPHHGLVSGGLEAVEAYLRSARG